MYLDAKLIALCFPIVDPKSSESMRDKVSLAPFSAGTSLIFFNSSCQRFATGYQVFLLSLLVRVLSREKRGPGISGHNFAFLSYFQGEHTAGRFDAITYRERSLNLDVNDTFLIEHLNIYICVSAA